MNKPIKNILVSLTFLILLSIAFFASTFLVPAPLEYMLYGSIVIVGLFLLLTAYTCWVVLVKLFGKQL